MSCPGDVGKDVRPLAWRSTVQAGYLAALLLVGALCVLSAFAASPASAGPNCEGTGSIDSEELQLLRLINDYRVANGRPQYAFSHSLNRSAAWKAQHIADNSYFAHDDVPIERTWNARIRDCGYTFNTYLGENLAGGNPAASGAIDIWQHSPGHDALLLSETFRAIGIGRAQSATGYWYWVADFGGELDARIAGGDVDCSGGIDTVDASLILQRAAGLLPILECETEADADASGAVDAMDALIVLQYAAGLVG